MTAKLKKLPVPPPNHPEASAAPDADGIPPFLDRKLNGIKDNPKPVLQIVSATPGEELRAGAEQSMRDRQAAEKKEKSRVRVEQMLAKKAGATKAMPLTGKAAIAAIHKAEAAIDQQARKGTPKKNDNSKPKSGDRKSKVDLIADLLKRKGGCTTADVLKATGWPSVSMPAQAKAAGLKLKKDKKAGEVTRYSAA